jgi:glycosyltransferase involved in cell wall biosynthesis
MRAAFAAYRSVGIEPAVWDLCNRQAPEAARDVLPFLTTSFGAVNVFHLNGDMVPEVLAHIGAVPPGYNIIVPFWELPRYPAEWARQLERFDEVWAASRYIQQSISLAVDRPVIHMPLPAEVLPSRFHDRRHFGIPENSYAFLFTFDCRSYMARKNPQAVVECFRRVLARRPSARTCLVMKVQGADTASDEGRGLFNDLRDLDERAVLLNATMPEAEVHNLVQSCDAFVSLHRSEGYGLGLAEAMYLGLPVIGTGYSGNLDFMYPWNSMLVGYRLVNVPLGAYPHAEDQHWAEPDLDEATGRMVALIDNPETGRKLGALGSESIRLRFSYWAVGMRYLQRLIELQKLISGATFSCKIRAPGDF